MKRDLRGDIIIYKKILKCKGSTGTHFLELRSRTRGHDRRLESLFRLKECKTDVPNWSPQGLPTIYVF